MKVLICTALLALTALASAESPVYGYHLKHGILKSYELMRTENAAAVSRIAGGQVTDISEIPYQVGLIMQVLTVFNSVCGGTLLSKNTVLTAAHCSNDGVVVAQSYTVVAGSNTVHSGGQRLHTVDATTHPAWNPVSAENDIAIIRIPAYFTLNEYVKPIGALARGDESFAGATAVASGWGFTVDGGDIPANQPLSKVELSVISNNECFAIFGNFIRDFHVCTSGANGQSICRGDTGGPLVADNTLIGIGSFISEIGCTVGLPAGFTRVSNYADWIDSYL